MTNISRFFNLCFVYSQDKRISRDNCTVAWTFYITQFSNNYLDNSHSPNYHENVITFSGTYNQIFRKTEVREIDY